MKRNITKQLCMCVAVYELNSLASARIQGFSKKMPKRTWLCTEIFRSGMLYRPGKSLKRRGRSSSLHSKKIFAWEVRVFCDRRHKWRTFRPTWPTLPGPGRQPVGGSISLSFYWKLGYNPSLLILWMTFWGFGIKICDVS